MILTERNLIDMKNILVLTFLILSPLFAAYSQTDRPQKATDYFLEANEKVSQQQFTEAISLFSKAIELDANFKQAIKNRGICFTLMRENNKALKDFNRAVNLDSTDADLFNFRGFSSAEIAHETGDSAYFDAAVKDIEHSIQLDSAYSESYLNLGIIYMWLNKYDLALQNINQAIKNDPNNPKAYYDRGIVYNKLGNTEKACLDWKKAKYLKFPLANNTLLQLCE